MRKITLLVPLFAAVSMSLAPRNARAVEPNVPYSPGDLILGLQLSGDNDVEVDLGSYTQFVNATSPFNVAFGVIPANQTGAGTTVTSLNADLIANFGSGWNSNPSLLWGVAGNNSTTLFLTQDATDPVYPSRPSTSQAGVWSDQINTLGEYGLGVSPSTVNSTKAASIATSGSNSWDTFAPNSDAFGTGLQIEQQNADPAVGSTLNLFELVPNGRNGGGNSTDLGSFALNNSGDLRYTPAAVPEPSTWLTIISGALCLVFCRRRRLRTS